MCRLLPIALLAAACHPPPPSDDVVVQPAPERTICGWKGIDEAVGVLEVDAAGRAVGPPPGEAVIAVQAGPRAAFEHVRDALAPYREALVRIDVVVEERWLLPLTFAGRPAPPMPGPKVETIVGHRRLIRPRDAPRLRFADVRVSPGAVRLFVENDKAAGSSLPLEQLAPTLRGLDPPASAFALTATADTPWARFVEALVAAACYDRGPGAEPHEVLLDERPPPSEGDRPS